MITLQVVAEEMSQSVALLCLDEMQVTDVADGACA
jgi:predicted ATPase